MMQQKQQHQNPHTYADRKLLRDMAHNWNNDKLQYSTTYIYIQVRTCMYEYVNTVVYVLISGRVYVCTALSVSDQKGVY